MVVLEHGNQYKECTCDFCNAKIGYLDSEAQFHTS